ncbi:MAG: hypothetical protein ABIQ01_03505 [Pseudolysinimonas sp.]
MRYLQAGVLLGGAALYLGVTVETFWLSTGRDNAQLVVIVGWNVLLIIVTALVFADSRRKARAGKTSVLATDLLIVKLAAIPFFIINITVLTWITFFGSALAAYGQSLESGGNVALVAAGAFALTYVAMLTTSTYGWATIAQLRRDGRIGAALGVLYRVLLLFFVADVVVGIVLYMHARRGETPEPEPVPRPRTVRLIQAGTLILGSAMYALVIAFSSQLTTADNVWVTLVVPGVWITLVCVVTALVVVDAVAKIRAGQTWDLASDGLVVKLVSIPFFILNFVVLSVLTFMGGAIFLFGGFALLVAAWVGIGLTYLTMLSTSVYVWATIARLRRDRVIGTGLAVLYMFFSFVFVTDIVAAIMVFGHSRRRPGLALVIVLLAVGVILTVAGLLSPDLSGMLVSTPGSDSPGLLNPLSVIGIVLIVGTIVLTLVQRRRLTRTPVPESAE